jgi:hypothetical protein
MIAFRVFKIEGGCFWWITGRLCPTFNHQIVAIPFLADPPVEALPATATLERHARHFILTKNVHLP